MSMLTLPEDEKMLIMILRSQFYHALDRSSCMLAAQLLEEENYKPRLHSAQLKGNALLSQV